MKSPDEIDTLSVTEEEPANALVQRSGSPFSFVLSHILHCQPRFTTGIQIDLMGPEGSPTLPGVASNPKADDDEEGHV